MSANLDDARFIIDPLTGAILGIESGGARAYFVGAPGGDGGSGSSLVVRSDTVTGNTLISSAPMKVFAITRISGTGTYSLHNGVTTAAPIPTGWNSIDGPTGTPYTPTQEPTELVNGGYFELVSGTGTFLIVWALGAE